MFSHVKKAGRKCFSLIELLIVIGIMGALAALILPHFSDSEAAAKDTACDYNNAGTLRYVTMFKAANGVYPSGFHTGADTVAASVGETDGAVASMAVVTAANMKNHTEALDVTGEETAPGAGDATGYGESLKEAGIAQLAYAKKVAEDTGSTVTAVRAISGDWSDNMNADGSYKSVADGGVALTIKGIKLSDWVAAGAASDASALSDDQKHCRKASEAKFKLVPLFAAPTMDWETAYPNGGASQASKVGVAMEGKCPWLEAGSFRYYICIFKVYEDGAAAKLLATACPECGILDADSF